MFTGAGKRGDWPLGVKAAIVAQTYSGSESVSAVARRHGLAVSQLFSWRRMLRKQMEKRCIGLPSGPDRSLFFVPAVILDEAVSDPVMPIKPAPQRRSNRASAVEQEIGGALARIAGGTDVDTITQAGAPPNIT